MSMLSERLCFLLLSNISNHLLMRNTTKRLFASEDTMLPYCKAGQYMTLWDKFKTNAAFTVKISPLSNRGSNQKMGRWTWRMKRGQKKKIKNGKKHKETKKGRVEYIFGGNCEKIQWLALGRMWEKDTVSAERGRRKD